MGGVGGAAVKGGGALQHTGRTGGWRRAVTSRGKKSSYLFHSADLKKRWRGEHDEGAYWIYSALSPLSPPPPTPSRVRLATIGRRRRRIQDAFLLSPPPANLHRQSIYPSTPSIYSFGYQSKVAKNDQHLSRHYRFTPFQSPI